MSGHEDISKQDHPYFYCPAPSLVEQSPAFFFLIITSYHSEQTIQ